MRAGEVVGQEATRENGCRSFGPGVMTIEKRSKAKSRENREQNDGRLGGGGVEERRKRRGDAVEEEKVKEEPEL